MALTRDANGPSASKQVRVFTRDTGGGWSLQHKLTNGFNPTTSDQFGDKISIMETPCNYPHTNHAPSIAAWNCDPGQKAIIIGVPQGGMIESAGIGTWPYNGQMMSIRIGGSAYCFRKTNQYNCEGDPTGDFCYHNFRQWNHCAIDTLDYGCNSPLCTGQCSQFNDVGDFIGPVPGWSDMWCPHFRGQGVVMAFPVLQGTEAPTEAPTQAPTDVTIACDSLVASRECPTDNERILNSNSNSVGDCEAQCAAQGVPGCCFFNSAGTQCKFFKNEGTVVGSSSSVRYAGLCNTLAPTQAPTPPTETLVPEDPNLKIRS